MSNVVQFSITGDTNAEQVAGRAKAAVGGLEKQMDGIGKGSDLALRISSYPSLALWHC